MHLLTVNKIKLNSVALFLIIPKDNSKINNYVIWFRFVLATYKPIIDWPSQFYEGYCIIISVPMFQIILNLSKTLYLMVNSHSKSKFTIKGKFER